MQRPSRQNSKDQGLEVGPSAPLRRQLAAQQVSRRSRAQLIPAALVNSLQGALSCACPEHIGALCLLGVWFGGGVVSVPGPQLVPWELVTLAMSWIAKSPVLVAEYLGSSFPDCEVKEGKLSSQDLSSSVKGSLTLLPSY